MLVPILGRLALAGLLAVALGCVLVWSGAVVPPNHLNPFAPLRIEDEVNGLTRLKLARLERNAPQCLAVLAGSSLSHKAVSDREVSGGCGYANAVEVTRSTVDIGRSFTATCPVAVAWALLEIHVIRPAARRHLGQDIVRITHLGTYACRNINNRASGRRSEHAAANAIDISGFVLAGGQHVTLKKDWDGADPRRAAFLRAVRDGACGFFDVVLGPDYNEAHRDHFHLDRGSYRACR